MTDKAKASEHDLREGSKPKCPNCGNADLTIWVRGSDNAVIVQCPCHKTSDDGVCNHISDFTQFFPALTQLAAILEDNQRLAKENCTLQDDIASIVSTHRRDWSWNDVVADVRQCRADEIKMRKALQTIAEWPFDIMGDCVKDATDLALAALAE